MIQAIQPDALEPNGAPPRMDLPTRDWALCELYNRALWENSQIGRCRRCAPNYWYFGKVMLLVQSQVADGAWTAWCVEHRIQRDRWKRGRRLALAFASADDFAELTIEAADALAREILGLPKRRSTADARLRRSLTAMQKTLDKRLEEFEGVTRADDLLTRIAELVRQLTALKRAGVALERHRASALTPKHEGANRRP